MRRAHVRGALMALGVTTAGVLASAQSPVKPCDASPTPTWCDAVVGDRAEGWLAQPRSEVMARNGIVATSQPLAAQAGLEILKRGGNAFDAAVATAAVLSVTEPMMVGPAGDMFAVLYGRRSTSSTPSTRAASAERRDGRTDERPGLRVEPGELGSRIRHAARRHPHGDGAGRRMGWDEVLHRFGTMTLKETLQPAIDYAEQGFPIS